MTIFVDTREKARAITKILAAFDRRGVKHISNKLYVGDYQRIDNPMIVVDRKQSLLEISNNVCQDHKRFIAELERANDAGIHIVFLIEHSKNINALEDVKKWVNPRLKVSPLAMSGERLHKIMATISAKYGCEFRFCSKNETGDEIIRILSDGLTEENDG